MEKQEKTLNPCPTNHKETKPNGICLACGYNTLGLTNKELKKPKCKNCGSIKFRAPIYQNVDVEWDEKENRWENGIDFSDPELETERIYCENCGDEFIN